jgi:hypothetical protein
MSGFFMREKLLNAVRSKLMTLPAYELKGKAAEIFSNPHFIDLDRTIRTAIPNSEGICATLAEEAPSKEIKSKNKLRVSSSKNFEFGIAAIKKSDFRFFHPRNIRFFSNILKKREESYKSPNWFAIWGYAWRSLSRRRQSAGLIAMVMIILAFLIKYSFPNLIGLQGLFILLFLLTFIITAPMCFLKLVEEHTDIHGVFSKVNGIDRQVKKYVYHISLDHFWEQDIDEVAIDICEKIIESNMSNLTYRILTASPFHLFFAFCFAFVIIHFSGDMIFRVITFIANILGYGEWDIFKKMTVEKLAIFLYQLGIPLSVYWVASGLALWNTKLKLSWYANRSRSKKFSDTLR